MAKRRKMPKWAKQQVDSMPVNDSDFDVIDPIIQKALQMGLIDETDRGFRPTRNGHNLLKVLPKPEHWFDTNDERVALLVLAVNGYDYPDFEE